MPEGESVTFFEGEHLGLLEHARQLGIAVMGLLIETSAYYLAHTRAQHLELRDDLSALEQGGFKQ